MPYLYTCFSCNKEFSAREIGENRSYLCPACGKSERNRPLQGVLLIRYDYRAISRRLSLKQFFKFPAGQFWLYPDLWPLQFDDKTKQFPEIPSGLFRNLALPSNLYLECELQGKKITILDDTRNPTFSFKDRASILVGLKARQSGITTISVASTGNAGSSMAGIAARMGLEARVWVPENLPENKRIQIQAYGAQLHLVKGDYDTAFDLNLEVCRRQNWYNRNTAFNPLTVEGKKSAAYDLFLSCRGKLPDILFIPVGDGVVLAGIYKGLWELRELGWIDRLPEIIAVQAEGSDALYQYWQTGIFHYQPAHTVADSICAGAPRNLYMAADAIQKTGGKVLTVSDAEILEAQQTIARDWGMLVEPAAAAGLAGYRQLLQQENLPQAAKVLLFFTGLGLKDSRALQQWNPPPPARGAAEWREIYHLP